MRTVLWKSYVNEGLERCVFERTADGHRIAGTVLLMSDGVPHEIRYTVLTDPQWRTHTVGAHVQGATRDRRLALNSDGEGNWKVSNSPLINLFGAIDIDLPWTPATNTIAIQRLELDVGESAQTTTVRIDFPGHDIARTTQHYMRIAPNKYRYESANVGTVLTVSSEGLILEYPDCWSSVASMRQAR